jgi:fumarate hydratase subunit alpha
MNFMHDQIRQAAKKCLIEAGTTYREDQFRAYRRAIESESSENARWVLEKIVENAQIAEKQQLPLCDDTGIPHVVIHIGEECVLPKGWLAALKKGIAEGLREMPGRPMAVRGNDIQRVEQSRGLHPDPGLMDLAPIIMLPDNGNHLKLTVLLLGGGPEIRAKTRRIFHKRSMDHVLGEVTEWLTKEMKWLGCTPTVPAVGIGRSQVEASALMLEAMAEGDLDKQSEMEKQITAAINQTCVGPLGLGGRTTALGCFLKVGPARASGVRIASVRPCCLMEPRRATVVVV